MSVANYRPEGQIECRSFGIANAASHRELTIDVPSPRNSVVAVAWRGVSLVHPPFIAVSSAHVQPATLCANHFSTMVVE